MVKNKIRIGILCVLLVVWGVCGSASWAAQEGAVDGPGWNALHVEPGQMYSYDLVKELDGVETRGEARFWISDAGEGLIEIQLEGEFDGEPFSTYATAEQGNVSDTYVNFLVASFQDLPEAMQVIVWSLLWHPWMETPLDGLQPTVGWEGVETDDYGDPFTFRVTEKRTYAGREGYVILVDDHMFGTMEVCIDPGLSLPLMVQSRLFLDYDEDWDDEDWDEEDVADYVQDMPMMTVELTAYAEDAVAPATTTPDRLLAQKVLEEVVDHFLASGLEVSDERQPKAYQMMGATAGFGVEVEGGDVELYLYDPETADQETLDALEEARSTGLYWFAAFEMEIPVVINGDILMTGLEFGDFYQHPARDDIIEAFMAF